MIFTFTKKQPTDRTIIQLAILLIAASQQLLDFAKSKLIQLIEIEIRLVPGLSAL